VLIATVLIWGTIRGGWHSYCSAYSSWSCALTWYQWWWATSL